MDLLSKKIIIPLLFGIIFFVVGLFTISYYGINWDEPFHFNRGQAYLSYFLSGGKTSYTFNSREKESSFVDQNQPPSYYLKNDCCHPPLNGIIFTVFNKVFYEKLSWLKDIEAYSLPGILFSSILVGLIVWFVSKEFSVIAGVISGLSLFFYPLFLGETHFNVKDPPETLFYSACIIAVFYAVTKLSWKLLVISGLLFGLSLGTKFNILFLPVILIPWFIFYYFFDKNKILSQKKSAKIFFVSVIPVLLILGFIILFIFWPFLWQNPVNNLSSVFAWYQHIGTGANYEPQFLYHGFNLYPWIWILYTTPPATLILSAIGIISALYLIMIRNKQRSLFLLILLWFLIPIVRVSVPEASIYGGDRQIMEFVPAMAILSGIGFMWLVRLKNKSISYLLVVLMFGLMIFSIYDVIKIHPNETVYFNQLAGGLSGAYKKNITEAGEDLGNVYRQGANWLNQHADKNAKLTLINNGTSAVPREFLRSDIKFSDDLWSGEKKQGEYIMSTTQVTWDSVLPDKSNYVKKLTPIYEVVVQGAPILKIWKND